MAKKVKKETGGGPGAARAVAKGLLLGGAAVGAAALANAFIFYKTPPLTSKLPGGEIRYWPTPDGDVFYKKAGDGPPLLLVHGIGAGCSSYEFRHIFEALSEHHTVYALDLLGFGKSDKPGLSYTHETYIKLIDDFARQVLRVGDGRGEADVIATSLSAAYVISVAQKDPSLFRRLVLICPTGIEELARPAGAAAVAVRGLFSAPIIGSTLYNAITSKLGVRGYLARQIYADPSNVTDEVVEQYHTAAHQPGGENVLPSFISGFLNINITEAFKNVVDLPLIVWGQKAKETPVSQAEAFLVANPSAKLEVIQDAGMLPHEEQPEAFLAAVRPFLTGDTAAATGTGETTGTTRTTSNVQ
jgi:pimeloyl-ACP methyl ester carboxylesterase